MRYETVKLILGMAAVTYLTRSLFLVGFSRWRLPPALETGLKYVPIGVLTSIVVPGILAPYGRLAIEPDNPYLWGGIAAGAGALRGWNPVVTMILGVTAAALARLIMVK